MDIVFLVSRTHFMSAASFYEHAQLRPGNRSGSSTALYIISFPIAHKAIYSGDCGQQLV